MRSVDHLCFSKYEDNSESVNEGTGIGSGGTYDIAAMPNGMLLLNGSTCIIVSYEEQYITVS
jgi:hypothetical protein